MAKFSSGSKDSGYSGTTVNTKATNERSNSSTFLFQLLAWAIWGIVGVFIFLNIKPYQELAKMLFAGVSYVPLQRALESIWIIGGLFKFLFSIIDFGVGTLFWVFVQALELIPTECMGNEAFLDKNIQRANDRQYQNDKRDPWEVQIAKRFRNSIPTEVLRFLILVGVLTYIADFFLCLFIFPPVVGGGNVWKLFDVLQLQQFGSIDWGNILKAVATVGAVQFLVKLRRVVTQVARDITTD